MSKKYRNTPIVKNRTSAFLSQAGRCFYCNQPMWSRNPKKFCNRYGITEISAQLLKCTAEHVVARQDGGTNQKENIVAACLYCNRTRHQCSNALSAKKYKVKVTSLMSKNKWHPVQVS
ncbi:HNH endonuclease [Acinetobacter junii]|uniref:HNH endonuclease n=1 Tax=Acinetobacter junii TaxID=40215 RepID=UPI001900ABC0|nr:HNH endonuclease [Acinetobacter junii]MBJ8440011.1 HNH endonuclease [Acinetobacter junii]